jgi:cytochrome c-type biogenesis protein CcmE
MSAYRDNSFASRDIAIDADHRARHRALAFLAGASSVALALGAVMLLRALPSVTPSHTGVDQLLLGKRTGHVDHVEGMLVAGSLVRQTSPCEVRFAMETNGFRMPVRHDSCVMSDPFEAATKDGEATPVMVEGELTPEGFIAKGVVVRAPSCCFCSDEARARQMSAWRESNPGSPLPRHAYPR